MSSEWVPTSQSQAESLVCLVFMPMLKPFAAVRAAVARSIAAAGICMCRLEEAVADAEWQYWLIQSVACADLVLVDVTDNNPFVMYELGVAHAQKLPVVLIVSSSNQRIPATVFGTPFLPYDETNLTAFEDTLVAILRGRKNTLRLNKLALENHTSTDCYLRWFEQAFELLRLFCAATSTNVAAVSQSEFSVRMKVAEYRGDMILGSNSEKQSARYLLARIIDNSDDVRVMQAVENWLSSGVKLETF